jgi:hypothetical protein
VRLPAWLEPLTRPHVLGMIGALILFLSIGMATAFATPAFHPDDEPRHAAYALVLMDGRIPLITEEVPFERLGIGRLRTNIMVAALHPPLYYVMVGPFLLWGEATGEMAFAVSLARVATLLMAVPGMLYTWGILRMLAPRRPEVAVLTLAFIALAPSFVNYSALIHTESLVFTTASGLLYWTFHAMIRGPSLRAVAWCAGWAAALTLTRFSGILVLGPALLGLAAAPLLHGHQPLGRRLLAGVGAGAAVLLVAGLASGWFYANNYIQYGDITGAQAALDTLDRPYRGPWYRHVFRLRPWEIFHDHMWAQLGGVHPLKGSMRWVARAFTLPALVGLLIAGWDARHRWRDLRWDDPRLWALVLGFIALAAVWMPVFRFFEKGGHFYPRYYFPVVWAPVLVVAVGWLGWRSRWPAVGAIVYSAVVGYAVLDLYLTTIRGVRGQPRDLILAKMFLRAHFGEYWVGVTLVLVAFAVGAVLVIRALVTDPPEPEAPVAEEPSGS